MEMSLLFLGIGDEGANRRSLNEKARRQTGGSDVTDHNNEIESALNLFL